jgi:hypothetical protein
MLSVDANRLYYSELPSESNLLLKNRNESFSSSDVEIDLLTKSYTSNMYDWFEPDCDQPWLFENINETECMNIFRNSSSPQREGTFLVSRLGKNYTLYFVHIDADSEKTASMNFQPTSNIYNIKVDSEFRNCQRSLWLEINQTQKFESIAELVSYYSQNSIETAKFSIRLTDGIDKEKEVKFQSWLALDMNSNEVDKILTNAKKKGSFLIRKSSGTKSIQQQASASAESGVTFNHVYTLVAYLNNQNRLYRFKILLQREGDLKKYKILNNEFSSLLDLVNYYRVNPIYENQVLTEPPYIKHTRNESNKENNPDIIKSLRSASEAQVISKLALKALSD